METLKRGGILAIMKNKELIYFPNGNDEEYRTWVKTIGDTLSILTTLGRELDQSAKYDILQDIGLYCPLCEDTIKANFFMNEFGRPENK
jgi:hypothetical protein